MRRLFIGLLTVLVLGAGTASAQMWAGISSGFPFGVTLHFGLEDVLSPGIDVRANGTVGFAGAFGVGADVLIGLPVNVPDIPIDVYAGGGPAVAFAGAGGFALAVNAFAGVEYRLGQVGFDPGGVFLEVGPTIVLVPAFGAGFVGRLGFNYHF